MGLLRVLGASRSQVVMAIVAEALLTYLIARGLAYGLAPTRVWAPFFGRDRFFLIVLASVLVRQHDQLWLLPWLSTWLEGQLGTALPPVREFYSIGLVLVPLTANLLWKPGPVRGLVQLGVITGLTYLVLAYVLMPWTNLSMSSFELLYEDTAVDFLGNAKSYILLLTTAAVAARFNLRYGWDFGGILLPALLGLLWFTPFELALTLAEALLLWAVVGALLRWTPLRRLNLEGPRKVALVFTLAVALKWLLSLAVGQRLPGIRARDLFGFGYLLSSLLALRMLPARPAEWAVEAYVSYHHNVPTLVQLMLWYFGIASLLPGALQAWLSAHSAEAVFAIIGLGLCQAAYFSEDLRSGLRAVPHGQTEAAPGITFGEPGDWRPRWLGRALGCEVRRDDDGVLAFRGPNACVGEWRDGALVRLAYKPNLGGAAQSTEIL